MIYGIILVLHLAICIVLVLVVLLQAGKGGGLAGAFGSMGMGGMGQSLFGGRGAATFLSKATSALGVAFMITSLSLALLSGTTAPKSVLRQGGVVSESEAPPNPVPLEMPVEGTNPAGATVTVPETPPGTAPGAAPAPGNESEPKNPPQSTPPGE